MVFQNEIIELLQFSPTTEKVYEIPLLIFPPWINKFYILDLRPENSMIRWLTSQGFTVFVASWVNPDPSLADKTFEDYMREGIYAAVERGHEQCGVPAVNTVGYCIGGTLLSCALAHMAAKGNAASPRPPSSPPSRTSPRPATCCSSPTRTGWRSSSGGWTPAAACCPASRWPTPSTRCAPTT